MSYLGVNAAAARGAGECSLGQRECVRGWWDVGLGPALVAEGDPEGDESALEPKAGLLPSPLLPASPVTTQDQGHLPREPAWGICQSWR